LAFSAINKLRAFGDGINELGYVEAGTFSSVSLRGTDGTRTASCRHAAETEAGCARRRQALIDATQTVPIVMTSSGDPVGNRFVVSLARPGGNVTGMSILASDLAGKRVELLKTVAPKITQVAVLVNPTNPNASKQLSETEAAAQSIGARLKILRVRSITEFDSAFQGIGQTTLTALLVSSDALFMAERRRIAALALAKKLPTMGFAREFAEDGTLLAYGPSFPDLYRRAAYFVDKILRGAKPADLPVEQPTKFEFIINVRTAKALGLTIPPPLALRADQLVE
jgi:putative ABC transport system substrate-binding protein